MGMQAQQNTDCCLQAALHLQTISTTRNRNTKLSVAPSASSGVQTHAPVLPLTAKDVQEPTKSFESNLQGLVNPQLFCQNDHKKATGGGKKKPAQRIFLYPNVLEDKAKA